MTEVTTAPATVGELAAAERAALNDLLARANRPGFATSEFWAPIIAPVVTFVITVTTGWAVSHGLDAGAVGEAATAGGATITSALAALAAREYVAVRGALKAHAVARAGQ